MAPVKIKDVAREAGVSTATVSLVLNGRDAGRVSTTTRQRVRDVATALGYSPNLVARSLRSQTSQTIGFISDTIATTPFAVGMIEAAQDAAWERGYLLFLINTGADPQIERMAIDTLIRSQVSGLIYACMFHQEVAVPPGLPRQTVFLDARPTSGAFRAVVPDDEGGAYAAVRELLDHGHRLVGFVDEELAPVASLLRLAGYRRALADYGLAYDGALHMRLEYDPGLYLRSGSSVSGETVAGRLLDLPGAERPTALFCFNDRMAMGAYRAARHRGLTVPGDVSIVGFDDQPHIAADLDPPLTTVALPHAAMGRWAVETLLNGSAANGSAEDVVVMPCPLIRRESVGPPPMQLSV